MRSWRYGWWLNLYLFLLELTSSSSSIQYRPTFTRSNVHPSSIHSEVSSSRDQVTFPTTYAYLFRLITISTPLKWIDEVIEETRLRLTSLNRYKTKTQARIDNYFEDFKARQYDVLQDAQMKLENRLNNVNGMYERAAESLRAQRKAIDDLNAMNAPTIKTYDSLDQFRREFNESLNAFTTKYYKPMPKRKRFFEEPKIVTESVQELTQRLQSQWQDARASITTQSIVSDSKFKNLIEDINVFQEDTNKRAQIFMERSKSALAKAYSKQDVKRERYNLGIEYEKLSKEGLSWIEARTRQLEMRVKTLQETISTTTQIYEELLNKRQSGMYYTSLIDGNLNKALNLLDSDDPGWSLIKSENGIDIYQKFPDGKFACVKAVTTINASPQAILKLLTDNSRVHHYNSLAEPGTMRDIEVVSQDTRVQYVRAMPMFPLKTRDFCTLFHVRKLKDGTIALVSSATTHTDAPSTNKYCRASIVIGANIIQPIPNYRHKCKLSMLTQLDPGGIIPPAVVNNVCSNGPLGFFEGVSKSVGLE